MKLIFVSGGVISGLGKGITASSIGRLLESRGLRVSAIKIDPYLNIDAGTMNPYEHGEVYVLDDGGEVDLDLGNYERFMDLHLTRDHNITTGKVYRSVIDNERRGDYLGKTVQIIPHVTDEIKRRITSVARESGADVVIVELGGTVGDMESLPFLEAARQLGRDLGREENVMFVHTTLIPIMGSVGEEKTKPTQHSVKELMSIGIRPDIIVGRCSEPVSDAARAKIAMFCDVPEEAVISTPDARSIYEVPLNLERQGVADLIIDRMRLRPMTSGRDMGSWERFVDRVVNPEGTVEIALVGKYTSLADSYLSHLEAFTHAGAETGYRVKVRFVDSNDLVRGSPDEILAGVDGVIVPGGFGTRGVEGMIAAARYARENGMPFLGVCLGFQIATIEIARDVLGLARATSTEFDPETPDPVICIMGEQLYDMSNGIDHSRLNEKYEPVDPSLTLGQTLNRDYRGAEVSLLVREMGEELAVRLRAQDKLAGKVSLMLGYSDGLRPFSRQRSLAYPTDDTSTLVSSLLFLLRGASGKLPIRSLSIAFGKLVDPSYEQLSLFEDVEENDRRRRLARATDAIHSLFGRDSLVPCSALTKASTLKMRHGQIGGHKQ